MEHFSVKSATKNDNEGCLFIFSIAAFWLILSTSILKKTMDASVALMARPWCFSHIWWGLSQFIMLSIQSQFLRSIFAGQDLQVLVTWTRFGQSPCRSECGLSPPLLKCLPALKSSATLLRNTETDTSFTLNQSFLCCHAITAANFFCHCDQLLFFLPFVMPMLSFVIAGQDRWVPFVF